MTPGGGALRAVRTRGRRVGVEDLLGCPGPCGLTMLTRLLVVSTQVSRRVDGGVESLTRVLAGLSAVQITVVTQRENDFSARWRECGMSVQVVPELGAINPAKGLAKARAVLACNRRLGEIARRSRAQLVQCNDLGALWGSCLAARSRGLPMVLSIRDTGGVTGAKWRLAMRLASRVVVNSREMRDRIVDVSRVHPRRVDFIHSAVDRELFKAVDPEARRQARARCQIAEQSFAVVIVGALIARKQQLELVRAVNQRAAWDERVTLHFVGSGDEDDSHYVRALTAEIERSPRRQQLKLQGFSDRVVEWYHAADLVLVASKSEGLARCMIEALSCGTPVVSFDVASAHEILSENGAGRVVAGGDFATLLDTVFELANDPATVRRMGERGAQVARRLFDEAHCVAGYRALYDSLL